MLHGSQYNVELFLINAKLGWLIQIPHIIGIVFYIFSECSKHCSLCFNETECYECTQGYFLNNEMECESKLTTCSNYMKICTYTNVHTNVVWVCLYYNNLYNVESNQYISCRNIDRKIIRIFVLYRLTMCMIKIFS